MYVVELEIKPDQQPILGEIPAHSVASLDTHDMPMFAAFWDGLDIEDRLRLGLLDALAAEKERAKLAVTKKPLLELLTKEGRLPGNDSALESILRAFLELLAVGPDQVMLVNLEDLWGETSPQNIPGTLEYGNWRRKARLSLEQFTGDARVKNVLRNIDRLRKEGTSSCR
jgi:4-alpha-glucanotransferase